MELYSTPTFSEQEEVKIYLTPKPFCRLFSILLGLTIANSPVLKLFCFTFELMGFGDFLVVLIYPSISILQNFDCQLHVGKTQAKYYCN